MNNKKGYTLVEILVAMGILAIMAIPILDMYTNSIKVNMIADNQIKADLLAQKYMETYKINDLPENSPFDITDDEFNVRVEFRELETDIIKDGTEVSSKSLPNNISEKLEMYLNSKSKIVLKNSNFSNDNLNVANYKYKIKIVHDLSRPSITNAYIVSWYYIASNQNTYTEQKINTITSDGTGPIIIETNQNNNLSSVAVLPENVVDFEIDNKTKRSIEVLLYNDVFNKVNMTVAKGSEEVRIYRNLTKDTVKGGNTNISYEVNVIVSKGNTTYTNLRSVIDKD